MKTVYSLKNTVQHYAWGSLDGISDFTDIPNPASQPMAELWMGSHPAAPSRLALDEAATDISLCDAIERNPEETLGKRLAQAKARTLPYLFKVLSAASPLSLQVHPSREQAQQGFARENEAGVPISAPVRNYKDSNHKPEIIMALTPFTAMCGFRNAEETSRLFGLLNIPSLSDCVNELKASGDYRPFCGYLLRLSGHAQTDLMTKIRERVDSMVNSHLDPIANSAFALVRDLLSFYPEDAGVIAPLYLNVIQLSPGEALYLPAGIMHAYVQGTGLELMANSDNVLRAGLTPKHIDVSELLSILSPYAYVPEIIPPGVDQPVYRYKTPSDEFELTTISIMDERTVLPGIEPAIVLGGSGSIRLTRGKESAIIGKGSSYFLCGTGGPIELSGRGKCYLATLPA